MFRNLTFKVMNLERFKRLKAIENSYRHDVAFLQMLPDSAVVHALRTLTRSKSQIRQDILALALSGFKKNGFFVEFGATDGVKFSNSYLLEKDFGWQGILGEPARGFHERLEQNRGCHIETNCVWRSSGDSLMFSEPRDGSLSSIADFVDNDRLAKSRKKKTATYEVATISLDDLLEKYDAPQYIDYLSVDTEGSELEILSAFDFTRRDIGLITVEHNFGPTRAGLAALMDSKGYKRIGEGISDFDDWYVRPDLIEL